MKAKAVLLSAGLAGTAVLIGQVSADGNRRATEVLDRPIPAVIEGGVASAGPDVIVGSLNGMLFYASDGTTASYAIGTTSCNIGTVPLQWIDEGPIPNRHPVIPQSIYRLKDGRFQQLGISWLKHGFCALQEGLCGACQPYGGCCCDHLGVGCSDPYSASLNGSQGGLGPRWEVNATTGVYPYPFSSPGFSGGLARRVQVRAVDVIPAQNPGALYWAEGQYVAPDDAAAGNGNNNVSSRSVTFSASFAPTLTGGTFQQQPAIQRWQVTVPSVVLVNVDVPNDGRYIVGYKVSDLGGGQWSYEYAIFNMNSHRSARSFTVPIGASAQLTNVGFSDVNYHSGEPVVGTDWTPNFSGGNQSWETSTWTSGNDLSTNAIRFGTMYNFWFTANSAPQNVNGSIGIFRPGTPTDAAVAIQGPSPVGAPVCPADLNGDGSVGPADLGTLLGAWGTPGCGGGSPCPSDLNGDGSVGPADLGALLGAWGPC